MEHSRGVSINSSAFCLNILMGLFSSVYPPQNFNVETLMLHICEAFI